MAATAVYAELKMIQSFERAVVDAPVLFSNINATTAAFKLRGGVYRLRVIGSTFGTVTLQELGPDGSTYITAATAVSANGASTVTLGGGTYKIALA